MVPYYITQCCTTSHSVTSNDTLSHITESHFISLCLPTLHSVTPRDTVSHHHTQCYTLQMTQITDDRYNEGCYSRRIHARMSLSLMMMLSEHSRPDSSPQVSHIPHSIPSLVLVLHQTWPTPICPHRRYHCQPTRTHSSSSLSSPCSSLTC